MAAAIQAPNNVHSRIHDFKSDFANSEPLDIARRHIVFGECAVISPQKYYQLRTDVANKFDIHPNDVLVVGSGKLGFSIAPNKRYRPFSDASDLDVAIVSDRMFGLVWTNLHRYKAQGGYWPHHRGFVNNLFRGWIRPDKFPSDNKFQFGKDWWEFFSRLSQSTGISTVQIRGGIYRNWHFLEMYQLGAIKACINSSSQQGVKT